jgi:hypothetical protein
LGPRDNWGTIYIESLKAFNIMRKDFNDEQQVFGKGYRKLPDIPNYF